MTKQFSVFAVLAMVGFLMAGAAQAQTANNLMPDVMPKNAAPAKAAANAPAQVSEEAEKTAAAPAAVPVRDPCAPYRSFANYYQACYDRTQKIRRLADMRVLREVNSQRAAAARAEAVAKMRREVEVAKAKAEAAKSAQ